MVIIKLLKKSIKENVDDKDQFDAKEFTRKAMYRDHKDSKEYFEAKLKEIETDLESLHKDRYAAVQKINFLARKIFKSIDNLDNSSAWQHYYNAIDLPDDYSDYQKDSDEKFKEKIENYREAINDFKEGIEPLIEADDRNRIVLYIDEYLEEFKSRIHEISVIKNEIYSVLSLKIMMAGHEFLDSPMDFSEISEPLMPIFK